MLHGQVNARLQAGGGTYVFDTQPSTISCAPNAVHLSLVVPTLNEAENISDFIAQVDRVLSIEFDDRYEIVIIDDESPDGTGQIALAMQADFPRLRVFSRSVKNGLGRAVVDGWEKSSGEILATINADFQHPPELLSELIGKIYAGADLAVATRFKNGGAIQNWSLTRIFLSRAAHIAGLLILPRVLSRVSDPMSGYFVFKRECIASVKLQPFGFKTLIEVLARGSVKNIAEVGYTFRERQYGKSKASFRQSWLYIRQLLNLRREITDQCKNS